MSQSKTLYLPERTRANGGEFGKEERPQPEAGGRKGERNKKRTKEKGGEHGKYRRPEAGGGNVERTRNRLK